MAFDLVRPTDFDMDDDELLSRVSALVGEKCPGVPGVVTFDAGYVSPVSDGSVLAVSYTHLDAGHPYGHGRFEYLAGLSVAVIVCSVGLNLVTESVNKLLHPSFTEYGVASMAMPQAPIE